MVLSLALVLLTGFLMGCVFRKLHLPGLLGMLLGGILLGPAVLNVMDASLLAVSADIRQVVLVIILMRAGLALRLSDLRKVGRPAVLLCFVPACFEIAGIVFLAPLLFGISTLDAAILGSVLAAVSPAVVVPRMLKYMEAGYGTEKGVPQLVMAGASVDDVFVIVLFTAFTSLAAGDKVSLGSFTAIPVSIVLGIIAGVLVGVVVVHWLGRMMHAGSMDGMIVTLGVALLLVGTEKLLQGSVPFSGLLAVMAMGAMVLQRNERLAGTLSGGYTKLWVGGEILLFVLVGSAVEVGYVLSAGPKLLLLLVCALAFRMLGVYVSLLGSRLNRRERLFVMVAYTPKATVQAAIGGIPLAMGLPVGSLVLSASVLSILLTAPLGAIAMDRLYRRCLVRTE